MAHDATMKEDKIMIMSIGNSTSEPRTHDLEHHNRQYVGVLLAKELCGRVTSLGQSAEALAKLGLPKTIPAHTDEASVGMGMQAVASYRNKICQKTVDMVFVRISDDVVTVTRTSNENEYRQPRIKRLPFQKCSTVLTER